MRFARDKLKVDEPVLERTAFFFQHYAEVVPSAREAVDGIPDPDDAWILSAALSAQVELFVTGDKPLLAVSKVGDLPLVDPRTAYSYVRGLA